MPSTPRSYPILSAIESPADLRALPERELPALASELRDYLVHTVSTRGGHFAAGLGTVELTLALHYVFNTPEDRLVWDVGHQAYPHKVLTGRRDRLGTIKQLDGLAPFPSRAESPYDAFGVGIPAPPSVPRWAWPWPPSARASRDVPWRSSATAR